MAKKYIQEVSQSQAEIYEAAWDLIAAWDEHSRNYGELSAMDEKISVLRLALTNGDELGLQDPESPFYRPPQPSED